jgi:hypothetical protein
MGKFGTSNAKDRVVTPPRPRPLINYWNDVECRLITEIFGRSLQDKALEILTDKEISSSLVDVSLTSRVFRDDPSDCQSTILIVVDKWSEDSAATWEEVVTELKKYIGMSALLHARSKLVWS